MQNEPTGNGCSVLMSERAVTMQSGPLCTTVANAPAARAGHLQHKWHQLYKPAGPSQGVSWPGHWRCTAGKECRREVLQGTGGEISSTAGEMPPCCEAGRHGWCRISGEGAALVPTVATTSGLTSWPASCPSS